MWKELYDEGTKEKGAKLYLRVLGLARCHFDTSLNSVPRYAPWPNDRTVTTSLYRTTNLTVVLRLRLKDVNKKSQALPTR